MPDSRPHLDDIDPARLLLCLQGIRALATGQSVGVEARYRYHSAASGVIGARDIPAYFSAGAALVEMNCHMLETSLEALSKLNARHPGMRVTTRIFVETLARPEIASWLQAHCEARRLPPDQVILALRESGRTRGLRDTASNGLAALRHAGFAIALDDVAPGPGLASSLRQIAPDILRVAPSLIAGDPSLGDSSCVATSMRKWTDSFALVRLGRERGFTVIATGVDTEDRLDIVTRMGFEAAQGSCIGPLIPAARFYEVAEGGPA